jgi:hypothetical protein
MTELLPILYADPVETVEGEVINGAFFLFEPNPFKRAETHLIDGLPLDARLLDYVERARQELPRALWDHVEVCIGEQRIDPQYWRLVTPKPEHLVYVRVRPQGKSSKNILRTVLLIAVAVAAFAFLGPGSAFVTTTLAGFSATTAALISGFAVAAATLAGTMLINALIPAPGITAEPNTRDPRFQLTGSSNRLVPYGRIPRVFGKLRIFPLLAGQPYTEIVGKDQYLRMLLVVGWGPLKISDIRIGETSIASFQGVTFEITEGGPSGWSGNNALTLYNRDVSEQSLNLETFHNAPSIAQTTQLDTVEISVDLTFPQGLVEWTKKGNKAARTVDHRVEYRAVGSGTWLTPTWESDYTGVLLSNGIIKATGTTQDVYRLTGRWKVAAGQYEVRVTRLTAAGVQDSSPQIDQSYWTALRSFADSEPVLQDGLCMIALRLKATDQLNGVPDRISCLVESYLPTTSNGTTWTYALTRNPAWAYADLLRRRGGEVFIPDYRIDIPGIMAWASANNATAPNAAEPRWTFDAALEGGSVFENLRQVAAIGRAAFTIKDGLYSVVRDVVQATPVQHITPRNSWGYSGSKTFIDMPHALKVEFQNAQKDYRIDELYVYADGYSEANATKFEVLQLFGATSPTLVYREARYHLAVGKLRPEEHYVSMDIEALRCVVGSRVEFSHDVIVVGTGHGRIQSLQTSGLNTTGLVLDSPVTFESGKTYQIRVRHKDGTSSIRTATISGGALGEFDTVVIPSETTAGGIEPGDLFMFGETGLVTSPMIVKRIEPGDDLSCRLTLVQYDPAIYTADTGVIPPFTSYMSDLTTSAAPSGPRIALRSGNSAIDVSSDGTVLTRLAVDVSPGLNSPVGVEGFEVQFRAYDGTNPNYEDRSEVGYFPASTTTVWINDLRVAGVYFVRARSRGVNGVYSAWVEVGPHTISGKTRLPAQPTAPALTAGYRSIRVSWVEPEDLDLAFVEVWASRTNTFGSATMVGRSADAAHLHHNLPGDGLPWYYWLVSVDTSENRATELAAGSATALSIADYEGIGDDGVLSPSEKLIIIKEYAVLTGEESSLVSAASTANVSSVAYQASIDALTAYLGGLSPAWNNVSENTAITRATWDANWSAVYTNKMALQSAIAPGVLTLAADNQAFTFTDGAANPGSQTITLTALLNNLSGTATWSTSPSVTLGGSGNTRTLTVANFGANRQVTVTATLGGITDRITIVRTDRATGALAAENKVGSAFISASFGANLMPNTNPAWAPPQTFFVAGWNPDGVTGIDPYRYAQNGGMGYEWSLDPGQTSWAIYQNNTSRGTNVYGFSHYYFRWLADQNDPNNYGTVVPVVEGQRVEFSVYAGNHRSSTSEVALFFYDAAGNGLNGSSYQSNSIARDERFGGNTITGYKRIFARATAPAGAVSCLPYVSKGHTDVGVSPGDSWLFLVNPMLCIVPVGQEELTPWAPPGNYGYNLYANGQTVNQLRPAELGANVTESRTAAAITGQGTLATANSAAWGSQITGRPVFTTDVVNVDGADRLNSWYVRNPNDGSYLTNRWAAELGANVTESRTAAAISGQSPWATTSISTGRVSRLQDDGFIQDNTIYRPGVAALSDRWPAEANANVTEIRTAAAISGQGDLATRNSATLPFGFGNLAVNSDFVNSTLGWGAAWDGTVGGTINRGINLSGFSGQINVLYAWRVGSPTAGTAFDAFITDAPGGMDGYRRFAIPVLPGERICFSWLLGTHRCSGYAILGFYDGSGNYISEVAGSTIAENFGAADGNPGGMGRSEGFATAPANARYARVWARATVSGAADPFLFCAQPFVTKVPSSQTVVPAYSSGPPDRAADVTSANTAAAITGQGALATRNNVDLASADITNKSLANLDGTANSKLGGIEVGADVTATAQRSIEPQFPSIEIKQGEAGHTGNRTVTHTAKRSTVTLSGGTWSLPSTNLGAGSASINSSTGTVTLSGIVQSGAYAVRYTHTDSLATDLAVNVTYIPTPASGVVSAKTGSTTSSSGVDNTSAWVNVITLTLTGCPTGRLFFNNIGLSGGNRIDVSSGTGTCDHQARVQINGTTVDTSASQNTVSGGVIQLVDYSDLFDAVHSVSSGTVTVTVDLQRTLGTGTISTMSNSLDVTVIAT